MNKIISALLIGLFVFNTNNLTAQQAAKIQMTPAEYQSLLETILEAKKKRMVKKKRYYYSQNQQKQRLASQNVSSYQTTSKIKELEKVYEQLTRQQQTERNSKELEQVRTKLESEMKQLRTELEEEQAVEMKELRYKLEEEQAQVKDSNNNIPNGSTTVVMDNIRKYDDTYLKERNRKLEAKILAIQRQQNRLIVDQGRSELFIKKMESKGSIREKDLEETNGEIRKLKRQIQKLEKNKQEMDELQKQIRILEKQQQTFVLLSQTKGTNTNQSVDTSTNNNAAYFSSFSKELVELEFKIKQLEAKAAGTEKQTNEIDQARLKALEDKIAVLNSKPTATTTSPATDYNPQLLALQTKIATMEAELKAYKEAANKPAPVIINTPAPVPTPVVTPTPKEELKSFVTSRRQQNVYFANGSTSLNSFEQNKVREIASWLSTYELLDITIKGFASNVGSFTVNQRISQKRAEGVKQALLNLGVQSKRIILEPLGIDATSTDPANARRAEIHLLIRE